MSIIGPLAPPKTLEEVWGLIRALTSGLSKLTFGDNFDGFEAEVSIPAATEVEIVNELRQPKAVPLRYVIVDHVGNGIVRKGDTAWTEDVLTLKNVSSTSSATVKVVFLRR